MAQVINLGRGIGPIPARIMVVGEAWGEQEEKRQEPFVGPSGFQLDQMLHEAGILRSEVYVTNVVNARPPGNDIGAWVALKKKDITSVHVPLRDKWVLPHVLKGYQQLLADIQAVQPNVIVACGNLPMWALTGKWAITKWRGSLLQADFRMAAPPPKVIPTIHPAAVLREWKWRNIVVNDLRRVKAHMTSREYNFPERRFIVAPSFDQVVDVLGWLYYTLESGVPLFLDFDLETKAGHIACAGISWSRQDAICIPFMCAANREGYWDADQEAWIVWRLSRILTHKRARVRWQNGLYDAQYTHRHWGFVPNATQDTMIAQHSIFSDQPKALAFIASMHCEHYIYWKDEGKEFFGGAGGREEKAGWIYNCLDCIYTREAGESLEVAAKTLGLHEPYQFQQQIFWPVLKAMIRGIRPRLEVRGEIALEIEEQISARKAFLFNVLGFELNLNSPKQMQALFYQDLQQTPIMTRAKKGSPAHVTTDEEALQKIAAREPLLRPIVNAIGDIRTLQIFAKLAMMKLDTDGRIRCSFNIGGSASGKSAPKTYRLSSNTSAFDCGGNLMNIPSEKSKAVGKYKARGHTAVIGDPYELPNIRSFFGPDPGNTWFDMDLDRADLQVVVWEVNDSMLKAALGIGADIHLLNAFVLDGKEPPPLEELVETHPKYLDHRGPRKMKREFAKVFCHATNYVGSPRTIAGALGRLVSEVDRAQRIWFGAHPGIKRWHEDVGHQVAKRRYVENKFGYRWYIFDRTDTILPEAVAWIPQSTVSIVINKIWANIDRNLPEAEVLLQVHDSLAGQFPTHRREFILPRLKEEASILVPYDDPLVIPVGISTSEISWGDVK